MNLSYYFVVRMTFIIGIGMPPAFSHFNKSGPKKMMYGMITMEFSNFLIFNLIIVFLRIFISYKFKKIYIIFFL